MDHQLQFLHLCLRMIRKIHPLNLHLHRLHLHTVDNRLTNQWEILLHSGLSVMLKPLRSIGRTMSMAMRIPLRWMHVQTRMEISVILT